MKAERYPPPECPALNEAHVDDDGDLYTWDGSEWKPFQDIPDAPRFAPMAVFGWPARGKRLDIHVCVHHLWQEAHGRHP